MSNTTRSENNLRRIEELETKVTFQEHLIEELNQALIQQQNDINKLIRVVENVTSQLDKISESNTNLEQVEIPPHY